MDEPSAPDDDAAHSAKATDPASKGFVVQLVPRQDPETDGYKLRVELRPSRKGWGDDCTDNEPEGGPVSKYKQVLQSHEAANTMSSFRDQEKQRLVQYRRCLTGDKKENYKLQNRLRQQCFRERKKAAEGEFCTRAVLDKSRKQADNARLKMRLYQRQRRANLSQEHRDLAHSRRRELYLSKIADSHLQTPASASLMQSACDFNAKATTAPHFQETVPTDYVQPEVLNQSDCAACENVSGAEESPSPTPTVCHTHFLDLSLRPGSPSSHARTGSAHPSSTPVCTAAPQGWKQTGGSIKTQMASSLANTRKCLTLQERVWVLSLHAKGQTAVSIARHLGVGKTQIQCIIKQKEMILQKWNAGDSADRKSMCSSVRYRDLSEKMGEWFRDASKRNIPINTKIIKEKALSMALELGYSHFHASNGWLDKWRKRNKIGPDFSYSECTESERRCNDLEDLKLVIGSSQGWEPAEQQQQQAQQISITSEAVGDTELEGSRLTMQAVCEDEAPAAKKRKRNPEKEQPLYVSLDREIVDSWNYVGIKEGLSSHAEIANFLISLYTCNQTSGKTKNKTVKNVIMPGGVCSGCQGPLTRTISCTSCHSVHGLEEQSASYVSGSQREMQTTSHTSGSQLYPEPPVVEPVSPLLLTCESSDSSQGPSQTVESLQPSESGLSSLHPERSQPSPASENQPFLVYPDFPEEVAVKTEDALEREMPKGKTRLGLSTPEVFMVRSERAVDLQNFEIAEIKTEPELHNDSSGSDFPVRIVKSKAKVYKESGHYKAKGNNPESVVDCVPTESLEAELAMQEKKQSASERSLQKMIIKVEECSDEESL